jgi:hypothetical protein
MSVPLESRLAGRLPTALEAERPDPDETEPYPYRPGRAISRLASSTDRM